MLESFRNIARRIIHALRRFGARRRFRARIFDHKSKSVCISLIEHMGDIVACEPVARRAREMFPDAQLVWCARRAFGELLESNPNIDQYLCVESAYEWSLWAGSGLFDVVWDLNVQGRPDFFHDYALQKTHGDRSVTINNWKEFGPLLPAFTRAAGLTPWLEAPRVYISDAVRASVDALNLPSDFVAIHCQSGKDKNWSDEKWRMLAEQIKREHELPVLEIGSTPTLPQMSQFCGRLSILQSAEVIRRARLFVGIDSGPAHLASAVGTPGVVLLGKWSPYACPSWATHIRADDRVADIQLDQVSSAVADQLLAVSR